MKFKKSQLLLPIICLILFCNSLLCLILLTDRVNNTLDKVITLKQLRFNHVMHEEIIQSIEDLKHFEKEKADISKNTQYTYSLWLNFYSSIIIFLVVLVIIGFGLYFSWLQFRISKHEDLYTTLKIGKDSLEINSKVLGLVILVISIVFFYIYIQFVYPPMLVTGQKAVPEEVFGKNEK